MLQTLSLRSVLDGVRTSASHNSSKDSDMRHPQSFGQLSVALILDFLRHSRPGYGWDYS